jgi:hypothetical protein
VDINYETKDGLRWRTYRNATVWIWRAKPQGSGRWQSWDSWQIYAAEWTAKTWCYAVNMVIFIEDEFTVIFPTMPITGPNRRHEVPLVRIYVHRRVGRHEPVCPGQGLVPNWVSKNAGTLSRASARAFAFVPILGDRPPGKTTSPRDRSGGKTTSLLTRKGASARSKP